MPFGGKADTQDASSLKPNPDGRDSIEPVILGLSSVPCFESCCAISGEVLPKEYGMVQVAPIGRLLSPAA